MNKRKRDEKNRSGNRYFMLVILILSLILSASITNVDILAAETTQDTEEGAEETAGEEETAELDLERTSPDNLNRTGYDIVYVIDNSRSVWSQQAYRNQAFKNITNLAVGADIRVGVVYFADHIYKTLALTSMETKEGSQKVLDFLNMTEQDSANIDTNIGVALEEAASMLDSQDTSRKKIVVLFSDGINENLAGDAAYKSSADQKTAEQVAVLKNMDTSIYCVYLQKSRNDEAYLIDLVNYFSNETDYAGERFFKVEETNISELSSTFAKVFYSMQNNMKYRQIKPDSSGNVTFYVPELGVTELKVYLDGNILDEPAVHPAEESEHENWKDGSAVFVTYENPGSGNWSIEIDSPDINSVFGTLAYYTDLQAGAELVEVDSEEGKQNYQLILHFYDENGEEIAVDDAARVTASVNFVDEEGNESSTAVNVTVNDGVARSTAFAMDAYGEYSYSVNLIYEDFVDLKYSLSGISVGKTAPVTTNIESGDFRGEKTDDGIQFSVSESQLWEDPEGEAVTITDVVQLNGANPVAVTQQDGYVIVTAEKASDVEFELKLQDSSGMPTTVSVQGTVTDQGVIRTGKNIFAAALVIAVLLGCFFMLRKIGSKKTLKKLFEEFDQISGEFTAISDLCDEEGNRTEKNRSDMELLLHGDPEEELMGVIEMASKLTEEQQEAFGVTEFLTEEYEQKTFQEANRIYQIIQDVNRTMYKARKEVKTISENQKDKKNHHIPIKSMNKNRSSAEESLELINKLYTELKAENDKLEEILGKISDIGEGIDGILNEEIKCNLTVSEISAIPNARGTMSARKFSGANAKGYYKLEDILLLGGQGALGSENNLGELGIYVYGYENTETGEIGLCLRSSKTFALKDEENKLIKVTEAKLLGGHSYKLTVNSRFGETDMKLSVK